MDHTLGLTMHPARPPLATPTAALPHSLLRFNKPYGVLSQFTPEGRWRGLKDFIATPGVYVAGRLDADSEGLLLPPPALWARDPPLRHRLASPTAWLELAITEGRNRQVRRMTAAVGHPCLRLVRAAVGPYTLEGLALGAYEAVDAAELGTK